MEKIKEKEEKIIYKIKERVKKEGLKEENTEIVKGWFKKIKY